jgi:hypothetical protein
LVKFDKFSKSTHLGSISHARPEAGRDFWSRIWDQVNEFCMLAFCCKSDIKIQ